MEQSKMTYPAGFRSGMKMTGLKSFQETQSKASPTKTKRNTVTFADYGVSGFGTKKDTAKLEGTMHLTGGSKALRKEESTVEEELEETEIAEEEVPEEVATQNTDDIPRSEATTVIHEVDKPFTQKFDNTNPFIPVKTKFKIVEKDIIPQSFVERVEWDELNLGDTFNYKQWENQTLASRLDQDKKRLLKIRPLSSHKKLPSDQKDRNVASLAKHYMTTHGGDTSTEADPL